jgi:glutaredoxin
MKYKLFSIKGCEKCEKVKEYLKNKNIDYEEINVGFGEGLVEFREFYDKNRNSIKREDDRTVSFPIMAIDEKIIQGLEKITSEI